MAVSFSSPMFTSPLLKPKPKPKSYPSFTPRSSFSDPFVLQLAETLEDSLPQTLTLPHLQSLRDHSSESLLSKPWPDPKLKLEPFRFTDTSYLKQSQITPSQSPDPNPSSILPNTLTILNGHVVSSPAVPAGAFAGSIRDLPVNHKAAALLGEQLVDGDVFFDLNGVGAADVAVVFVPAGVRVSEEPVHVRVCYDGGSEVGEGRLPVSNPRVLVVAEKGAEVGIVEEHLGVNGSEGKCYWGNSVVEVVVEEGARVSHTYLQRQSVNSAHIKWTFTRQVIVLR